MRRRRENSRIQERATITRTSFEESVPIEASQHDVAIKLTVHRLHRHEMHRKQVPEVLLTAQHSDHPEVENDRKDSTPQRQGSSGEFPEKMEQRNVFYQQREKSLHRHRWNRSHHDC